MLFAYIDPYSSNSIEDRRIRTRGSLMGSFLPTPYFDEFEDQLQDAVRMFEQFGRMSRFNLERNSFRDLSESEDDEENNYGRGGVYTYSSSRIVSSTNEGGAPVYIEETKTMRKGTSGISEVQQSVKDTRTGLEKLSIKRMLGNKSRTLTKQRDASGREESLETLRNISRDEADQFDNEWCRMAQDRLPNISQNFSRSSSRNSYRGSSSNTRALPPTSQRQQQQHSHYQNNSTAPASRASSTRSSLSSRSTNYSPREPTESYEPSTTTATRRTRRLTRERY